MHQNHVQFQTVRVWQVPPFLHFYYLLHPLFIIWRWYLKTYLTENMSMRINMFCSPGLNSQLWSWRIGCCHCSILLSEVSSGFCEQFWTIKTQDSLPMIGHGLWALDDTHNTCQRATWTAVGQHPETVSLSALAAQTLEAVPMLSDQPLNLCVLGALQQVSLRLLFCVTYQISS